VSAWAGLSAAVEDKGNQMIDLPPNLLEAANLAIVTVGGVTLFRQSVGKIAGEATDEIVGFLQDSSQDKRRYKQFERQVRMFIKAQEFLTANGLESKSVPLKSLVPMLEGVRLEEDESMQNNGLLCWRTQQADT